MEIRYIGIRHHGPGSAKNLVHLLEEFQPDCILVEMPLETEALFEHIGGDLIKPPVSILVHDKKDPSRVSYLPFTIFSPEWQAISWANKAEKTVRAIDLPLAYFKASENYSQGLLKDFTKLKFSNPLLKIAQLAGFKDHEQWWNETFEQHTELGDYFPLIEYMMDNLRDLNEPTDKETLVREAFMRKQIRTAAKEPFERVIVLVGAWHLPAVKKWSEWKASADNALLKPLKKIKVEQFFIPWSYEQISMSSGYRAGVYSPAWYEHLFVYNEQAVDRWLILAGRLLRQKGFVISPAQISDAAILSRQLAQMRSRRIPGIAECWDAIQAVIGQGHRSILNVVWADLVIGKTVGKVDKSILAAPLFKDLEKQLKSARMGAVLNSSDRIRKELDLRKDSNLRASRLFHRLLILEINLAALKQAPETKRGSFSEIWSVKWMPSLMIKLSEAGVWGNSIEIASAKKLVAQAYKTEDIKILVDMLETAQKANLSGVFESIIDRLFDVLVINESSRSLLEIIPGLVGLIRYGDLRQTNVSSIIELLERLIPNISSYLPDFASGVSDDDASAFTDTLLDYNHALDVLGNEDYDKMFNQALLIMIRSEVLSAEIQAASLRLLFDKRVLAMELVAGFMRKELNRSLDWERTAFWLKGFLRSNPDLFLYNRSFRQLVDQWVDQLQEEDFKSALPTLRKAFSGMKRNAVSELMDLLNADPEQESSDRELWVEGDEKLKDLLDFILSN